MMILSLNAVDAFMTEQKRSSCKPWAKPKIFTIWFDSKAKVIFELKSSLLDLLESFYLEKKRNDVFNKPEFIYLTSSGV